MMVKNNKNKVSLLTLFIILAIILDLFFLYFIKYQNQNLSVKEFNLNNIGNIINLLFTLLLLTGIIVSQFLKKDVINSKVFLGFLFLTQLFLIGAYISTIVNLPFKGIYIFRQNGNRLFIASLFTLFSFSNFVLLFIVWLSIIKTNNIVILRSIVNSAILMFIILLLTFLYIVKKEAGLSNRQFIKSRQNIGVVLGAAVWSNNKPSPSLAARVDKAINLYERQKISKIYLTGSNAPGELAESEVALNYLRSLRRNIRNVSIEKKTTSTNEQISFIKKVLYSNKKNHIIVISDSYHLVRVLEISKFQNIKIDVAPSDLTQSFGSSIINKVREALALTIFWFFAI